MSAPRRSARNSSKRPNPEDNDVEDSSSAAAASRGNAAARSSSKASDKRQKQEPLKHSKGGPAVATATAKRKIVSKAGIEELKKDKEEEEPPQDANALKKGKKAGALAESSTSRGSKKTKQASSKAGSMPLTSKEEQDESKYPILPAGLRVQKETTGKWLMKSEPDVFSLDDLYAHKREGWDGVRNYMARNLLASMVPGDQAFFYHSNTKVPGIVGIMTIVEGPSLDETQFDPKSKYYDPKASRESPRWVQVHVEPLRRLSRIIDLAELRSHSTGKLKDMMLFKQTRLSVSAVTQEEWDFILSLEEDAMKEEGGGETG